MLGGERWPATVAVARPPRRRVETVVFGIGAVLLAVPPVAVVYHNKFVPVADSAVAVAFWQ